MDTCSAARTVILLAGAKFELAHVRSAAGLRFIPVAEGPGFTLARAGLEEVREPADAIVSTGLCGALDPALRVGDIVVASSVNGTPVDQPTCGGHFLTGPVASVDRVVGTRLERQTLARSGTIAVDMESAVGLGVARQRGIPFYCIRAVSDEAEEDWALDLNATRTDRGGFDIPGILLQAARRPFAIVPELARLRRNAGIAARSLGKFLGACEF